MLTFRAMKLKSHMAFNVKTWKKDMILVVEEKELYVTKAMQKVVQWGCMSKFRTLSHIRRTAKLTD